MIGTVLYVLLAFDLAAFAHGDFSPNAAALVALVLAVVALVPLLRSRV